MRQALTNYMPQMSAERMPQSDNLMIKANYQLIQLKTDDILFIKALADYVIIKTTVNTSEPGEEMSTRVYPNPSAGETWLEFNLPEAQPVRLKIADQMGRIIWENNIEEANAGLNRLQLPPLPAGTYALAVQSGISTRVEKMVQVERP